MGVVVFALLVLSVDAVFITTHRSARTAEVAADVTQNARVAVERLTREIRESGASASEIREDVDGVIFKTARPADNPSVFCVNVRAIGGALYNAVCNYYGGPPAANISDYAPVWQRFVAYYLNGDGELVRYVGVFSPTSATAALPDRGDVPGLAEQAAVIATSVESLEITVSAPDRTVAVTLRAKGTEIVQGSEVPPQRTTLETTVLLRNTFGP